MSLINPFRALRPAPGRAAEILAPPYDVLSSAEARVRAKDNPWSFLHISKPEIDLDPAVDPYDQAVYAKAAENLKAMVAAGVLIRDDKPCYYVYRLTWRGHAQTGLAAAASVADYNSNRIRKHELTTPVKEDDRVRQIEAINAQTGPVMIAYPAAPAIDGLLRQATGAAPVVDVTVEDVAGVSVGHQLWVVSDRAAIDAFTRAFDALPALYIADGHHRSAAAARVAKARRTNSASQFLAVIFPHHQMTILDYNRLLKDLNGRSAGSLLDELRRTFGVAIAAGPVRPTASNEFGLFLAGTWHKLTLPADKIPKADPIGRLPITLLTRHVIEPLFGITDPRIDKRIDFVGGGRGLDELARRVSSGEMAAAFSLYPTQMDDLMAVADAGGIMPPKSTWFEPKLADGMVSHVLD